MESQGQASLIHLLKHKDKLELVSIVRDSEKNKKLMEDTVSQGVRVIWGDLRDYNLVKKALKGADIIIHLAALVSPKADYFPELAWDINVGSTDNILKGIQELKLFKVKLVHIGTVAQTGSRLPPIHCGRVGDPIKSSTFDAYAASKNAAERKVIESGLENWVSLRQTGILHEGLLTTQDGIIFHQPLNNVLEWVSDDDSGRLIANLCTFDLPDTFWKQAYNIGGGPSCRINNYDFMSKMLALSGIKDVKKIFERNWFATQNFHGQYYLDSDKLNDLLDFRRESVDDFMVRMQGKIKFPSTLLKYIPSAITKNRFMKKLAESKQGSLAWIKNKDSEKIKAFFGSVDHQRSLGNWSTFKIQDDYNKVLKLNHGYDESKGDQQLELRDMQGAAIYRGGQCLSKSMKAGDLQSLLEWSCALGHEFLASPDLVLKTGHWCPYCEAPPWNYDAIAKVNPFFNQVWKKYENQSKGDLNPKEFKE